MASSRTRNMSCRVHPLAVTSILDAYIRRAEGNQKSIGSLLGYVEGNCLVISDAFTVLHRESEDTGVISLDKEYHRKLAALRKKSSPNESVIGWFATCEDIEPSFVAIHNFYSSPSESKFVPTPLLPSPVLLTLDPTLSSGDLNMRVCVMQSTVGADSLFQFHDIAIDRDAGSNCGLTTVFSMLQKESKIVGSSDGDNSQTCENFTLINSVLSDLKEIEQFGDLNSSSISDEVSMAIQSWKLAARTNDTAKAIADVKAMATTHLELVTRIRKLLQSKEISKEIVI